MDLKIVTKFTVATDAGVDALMYLTETIAREKFSELVTPKVLDDFIAAHYSEKKLTDDLNDMLSHQWLVVYANGEPAGYAQITSQGKAPEVVKKSSVRIAEFGVVKKHNDPLIWQSLYEKCYNVSKSYDMIWLNEFEGNPVIDYFEKNGFNKIDQVGEHFELPLPSVYLVREKE